MPEEQVVQPDTSLGVESSVTLETPEVSAPEVPAGEQPTPESHEALPERQPEKDEELKEFAPSVSSRLRAITKSAPELDSVLKKYPDLRNTLEATFRRDAAYREIFPTVADARQLREMFPNGATDAQEMMDELAEVEALDQNFMSRDASGQYPGHSELIQEWHKQNPAAFSALVEKGIAEWARLDAPAYQQTFSAIIGNTFQSEGIFRHLDWLERLAEKSENEDLKAGIKDLAAWAKGFGKESEQRELSPEAKRLREERQALDRDKDAKQKQDAESFHKSFMAESNRLQRQIVENHPLMKRLPPSVSAEKRTKIVTQVLENIREHLSKTGAFMRKLTPAYNSMDLKSTLEIQKRAWSQEWLLGMYVRRILAEATPGIVQATRPGVGKTITKSVTPTAKPGAKTEPYQIGKQWFHPDGRKYTMEEALRMP